MTRIVGIMPLRNAVKLGYPFELAVKSLQRLCDAVIIGVDPTSEDDTLDVVTHLRPDSIVCRTWDMGNHQGHTNCEITVQTRHLIEVAPDDCWIFSLQADEIIHEAEVDTIRRAVGRAADSGVTGIELLRLYFYEKLTQVRDDWSLWMVRLFRKGFWRPDVDGAMRFDPIGKQRRTVLWDASLYHYSRMGNPHLIAERVRNLDRLFHPPEKVASGALPDYDFQLRKLDTYVIGHAAEAADAKLIPFDIEKHPAGVREWFT